MAKYTTEITDVMIATYVEARAAGNPNKQALATTVKELSTVHDCDLTTKMVQGKLVAEKVFVAEGKATKVNVEKEPRKQGIVAAIEIELGIESGTLDSLTSARKDSLEALYVAIKGEE